LLASGVCTVAACKLLGIGDKTVYRWRAENGGLPPARLAESSRSGRFLSLLERQRIATLRGRGLGAREIAHRLGRAPSTISRELRRYLRPHDQGSCDSDPTHARAREEARRTRRPLLAREPELRRIVQDELECEWSPAQIAAHLREAHPDRTEWRLCHETIYQALPRRKGRPEQDVDPEAAHRLTAQRRRTAPRGRRAGPLHRPAPGRG
jgi:IS30 family transposase